MTHFSHLSKLAELAKEPSSERRRQLLRDITDLYFANQNTCSDVENEHFSEILTRVTDEMHKEVRKEMAERFAKESTGPIQLLHKLANDDFDIAGPVLRHSSVLQDKHLKEVIASKSQEHLRAISVRDHLSTNVTRDIVKKGDDETLVTLVNNQGARFDRNSMQTMVDRSENVIDLQAPLVEHQDLPPDLMNDMYMFAEQEVRKRIVARNEEIDPKTLQEALELAKDRIIGKDETLPDHFAEAKTELDALHKNKKLDGPRLIKFERGNERLKFTLGLSILSAIDFATIDRILQRTDTEALALVCKSIEFDGSLFATIALLVSQDKASNTGHTAELRTMYQGIPAEAAKRTIRFWQMRQKVEAHKAA